MGQGLGPFGGREKVCVWGNRNIRPKGFRLSVKLQPLLLDTPAAASTTPFFKAGHGEWGSQGAGPSKSYLDLRTTDSEGLEVGLGKDEGGRGEAVAALGDPRA